VKPPLPSSVTIQCVSIVGGVELTAPPSPMSVSELPTAGVADDSVKGGRPGSLASRKRSRSVNVLSVWPVGLGTRTSLPLTALKVPTLGKVVVPAPTWKAVSTQRLPR